MNLGLAGRACAVSGAGRGIGREAALALCAEGARVLLVGREERRLREVQEEADGAGRTAGGRAAILACDPAEADSGERILATASEYFGQLDVLVNATGAAEGEREEATEADWNAAYERGVIAPLRAMRAVAPPMAERGWGRIVNVYSTAARRPSAELPEQSIAQAAGLSLSRLFADRYARQGVLVNAVCPTPAAREEAVGTIAFLCSERASYVAGAAWPLDGGAVRVSA